MGSVGLRAYVALLEGSSPDDVLFLQLKQARRSVLARYVHGDSAWHAHQGQRVVEYQQALQTVSDPLLGLDHGRRAAVLRPAVPEHEGHHPARRHRRRGAGRLRRHRRPPAGQGARPHQRRLDDRGLRRPVATSWTGRMARFARAYADQTEADHAALVRAVRRGALARHGGCPGPGRLRLPALKSARLPDRQRERPGRQSTPRPTTASAPMQNAPMPAYARPRVTIRSALVDLSSRSDAPLQRWPGIPEHYGRDAGWQVATAQRGDEPVDSPVAFALDALDCEDHPGAADVWVQATGVRVMSDADNLFTVNRALVDPIDREANVGASGVATSDDFLADDRASKDGIGFPQRAIGGNSSTAAGEGFRRVDDRDAGAQQHGCQQDDQAQRKPRHLVSLDRVEAEDKKSMPEERS